MHGLIGFHENSVMLSVVWLAMMMMVTFLFTTTIAVILSKAYLGSYTQSES